jgi:hypothetical protein
MVYNTCALCRTGRFWALVAGARATDPTNCEHAELLEQQVSKIDGDMRHPFCSLEFEVAELQVGKGRRCIMFASLFLQHFRFISSGLERCRARYEDGAKGGVPPSFTWGNCRHLSVVPAPCSGEGFLTAKMFRAHNDKTHVSGFQEHSLLDRSQRGSRSTNEESGAK